MILNHRVLQMIQAQRADISPTGTIAIAIGPTCLGFSYQWSTTAQTTTALPAPFSILKAIFLWTHIPDAEEADGPYSRDP